MNSQTTLYVYLPHSRELDNRVQSLLNLPYKIEVGSSLDIDPDKFLAVLIFEQIDPRVLHEKGCRVWRFSIDDSNSFESETRKHVDIALLEDCGSGQPRVLARSRIPVRVGDTSSRIELRIDDEVRMLVRDSVVRTKYFDPDKYLALETEQPSPGTRKSPVSLLLAKLLGWISKHSGTSRRTIFCLHDPAPDILDELIWYLKKRGRLYSYSQTVEDLRAGVSLDPGFVLTFDDGRKRNANLLDVLGSNQCSAMFFLVGSLVNSDNATWTHRGRADMKDEWESLDRYNHLLSLASEAHDAQYGRFSVCSEEMSELLTAGQELGLHTQHHLPLSALSESEITSEILSCIETLTALNPDVSPHLAYPYGDFDERVIQTVAKLPVLSAATTEPLPLDSSPVNLLRLPRVVLSDVGHPGLVPLLCSPTYQAIRSLRSK